MAHVVKDRVQETSTTTGTGTLTLDGAVTGFQTFSSAIGNTNTTYYAIQNGSEWEVGIGTVGAGTLSRDTILESSNAGSAVNLSAGTKFVFCTYPAEKSVDLDTAQTLTNKTISGSSNTLSNIGNASLTNSSITINGSAISLGGSTSVGTVTSVGGTGSVNGITLTGTVTSSGSLTLGGTLSGIGNAQLTNSSITINGTAISLGGSETVTAVNPNALTIGTGLSGTSYNGSAAVTIAIDSTVATLTGTQTLTNKTLTDPTITGTIIEDVFALTDSSTVDIDPANGSIQTLTLAGTGRTLTFTNMVNGEAITLMINDGTAGTITTWNATFVNNSGSAPTLSLTGFTVVSVWKVAGTVYAAVVGNA